MKVIDTSLEGVKIVEPAVFGDSRGWFMETFSQQSLEKQGISREWVQDNHSLSSVKGILRGLHFQNNPCAQSKLVRCSKGKILDVAVDIRKNSPQYLEYVAVELSSENKKQLYIPQGFAHGFLTLSDDVEVQYKVDNYYNKDCDRGIAYNDKSIAVAWAVDNPQLSDKDKSAPSLENSDCNLNMKVLVTGVKGQLGHDVVLELNKYGYIVDGVDYDDFDITDTQQVQDYIFSSRPDIVVHCAAYTQVDKAESDKDKCYAVNVTGSRNLALACKSIEATMVYISTDYVYNGEGLSPFTIQDIPAPLNVYGVTKLKGEQEVENILRKCFVVRTSWVYGINGNNFVKTMIKLGSQREEMAVVCDQVGSPTYTVDLAKLIVEMIKTKKYGKYNASNEGYCSWYEFAQEIFNQAKIDVKLSKVTTDKYPTAAKRPHNSRMSKECLTDNGFSKLPDWKDALKRYMEELL